MMSYLLVSLVSHCICNLVTATTLLQHSKPMRGYNSWNSFKQWVNESQLLSQAEFIVSSGMADLGWEYIVSDGGWYYPSHKGPVIMDCVIDNFGRLLPTPDRYPSGWQSICDELHAKGLKCGFHMFRGVAGKAWELELPIFGSPQNYTARDAGTNLSIHGAYYDLNMSHPAASQYVDAMFELYCTWGIDFIKLDGVGHITRKTANSYDAITAYRNAIDKHCKGKDVVISLSAGSRGIIGWGNATENRLAEPTDDYVGRIAHQVQMIRVTPDSWDIWDDEPDQTPCPLTTIWAKMKPPEGSAPQYLNATGHSGCCWGGRINKHFEEFARFAHIADTFGVYPDGDMMQLGRVGSYPNLTSSGLAGYGVSSLEGIFPQPPPVANCTVYQLLGLQHTGTAYDPGDCPRQSYLDMHEQRTLMTLWSIARSPLIMGGDLTQSPPEVIALLTNKDILHVNEYGRVAKQLRLDRGPGKNAIWTSVESITAAQSAGRSIPDVYVAFFNLASQAQSIEVNISTIFNQAAQEVMCSDAVELWSGRHMGFLHKHFRTTPIPRHGTMIFALKNCSNTTLLS